MAGRVFLSHAAADAELAEFIERQLRLLTPGLEIFRTTRVGQIPTGKDWLAAVKTNLRSADAYMVLLTPWSMSRPWICFETGAAWMTDRTLVPALAGGLEKGQVVEPLASLQLLSLENPEEAAQAFLDLGSRLGDPAPFASAVMSLSLKGRAIALEAQGWEGIEFQDAFYAWEGPIEQLADGQPRAFPNELLAALKEKGLSLTTGLHHDLLNEQSKGYALVYLIDAKRQRKHILVSKDKQVLLAKPGLGEA